MKRQHAFSLLLATLLVLVGAVIAGSGRTGDDATLVAPPIGATIEDFKLPDADGKEHSLNSLKGKNGSVLIFISVQCPISNAYNERMEKLAQDYGSRGVTIIGINANNTEPADAVKVHAAEKHLTFPILKIQVTRLPIGWAPRALPRHISWTPTTGCSITGASTTTRMNPRS